MRVLLLATALIGCAAASPTTPPPMTPRANSPASDPIGTVTRAELESLPKWRSARADAHADLDASRALLKVPPGAKVRVFLGTWCSDSRRELARLFDALDRAGGPPPFALEYLAVDRGLSAPGGITDGADLHYVPTFIVMRDGKEVGRIIESAPNGIEHDLATLLRGERSGVITGRVP